MQMRAKFKYLEFSNNFHILSRAMNSEASIMSYEPCKLFQHHSVCPCMDPPAQASSSPPILNFRSRRPRLLPACSLLPAGMALPLLLFDDDSFVFSDNQKFFYQHLGIYKRQRCLIKTFFVDHFAPEKRSLSKSYLCEIPRYLLKQSEINLFCPNLLFKLIVRVFDEYIGICGIIQSSYGHFLQSKVDSTKQDSEHISICHRFQKSSKRF